MANQIHIDDIANIRSQNQDNVKELEIMQKKINAIYRFDRSVISINLDDDSKKLLEKIRDKITNALTRHDQISSTTLKGLSVSGKGKPSLFSPSNSGGSSGSDYEEDLQQQISALSNP